MFRFFFCLLFMLCLANIYTLCRRTHTCVCVYAHIWRETFLRLGRNRRRNCFVLFTWNVINNPTTHATVPRVPLPLSLCSFDTCQGWRTAAAPALSTFPPLCCISHFMLSWILGHLHMHSGVESNVCVASWATHKHTHTNSVQSGLNWSPLTVRWTILCDNFFLDFIKAKVATTKVWLLIEA